MNSIFEVSSYHRWRFAMILLTWWTFSCNDTDVLPPPEPAGYLIDATRISTVTSLETKLLVQFSGLGLPLEEFRYDVEIFTITYHTTYQGADIIASGLVALPKTANPVGMLSFQHGTIVLHADAPSQVSTSDPNILLYGALSSSGFIGVIPDYLGFGASASLLHPYYVEDATASAVVDMLMAARELSEQEGKNFNGRLFLAGYSEGGYATVAAHKSLESTPLEGYDLMASFAGAGAYDISGMQAYLFAREEYEDPYYLAYLTMAYQFHYNFPDILTDFFLDPYADAIPALFDGMQSPGAINAQLTTKIGDLVEPGIIDHINTDPAYEYLVDAFQENSLTDWAPEVSLHLYHGVSDTTIPFENSNDTYNALLANGASPDIVSITTLEGNHTTALTPYIQDFVPKLWLLR